MITVAELLPHPSFKGFELISDSTGLHNRVRDCKIFEWETGEALDAAFHPGDFVVTTLTPYRDSSPSVINLVVQSLLEKNIAALAVRDIYFKSLPEEVITVANDLHIPVFLFDDNPFDDIIFTIKSSATAEDLNNRAVGTIRSILYEKPSPARCELLARDINPFFNDNIIAGYFLPRDHAGAAEVLSRYAEEHAQDTSTIELPNHLAYSLIRFPRGIALLMSDSQDGENLESDLLEHYEKFGFDTKTYAFGIGTPRQRLHDIGICFKEAFYAAAAAYLDNHPSIPFRDIGLLQIIAPTRNNPWITRYYDEKLERLAAYDQKHDSELLYTLTRYVDNNYNVNKTAEDLFQHGNTIRYRVKKAMEVLNIGDGPDGPGQIYVLVRLHELYELLLHENL